MLLWTVFAVISQIHAEAERKFPSNFRFGIGTSAYQIEGAWNASDKGESVWDRYTHEHPENIADYSTGDVACDSYNFYMRDVEMLEELGVHFYRFSVAWTRILPKGYAYKISDDGFLYYDNLINELIKNNIEPMVTIFHWDTPQVFQTMGGWTNPAIVEFYTNYARVLFELFGSRVKEWITFSDPFDMCLYGYGTAKSNMLLAPGLGMAGIAEYQCVHNVLKAHARVYHMYDEEFRLYQKGKIGIANPIMWAVPDTNDTEHFEVANATIKYINGWITHPIYSKTGDYPSMMRYKVDDISELQGFTKSRLPKFTPEEVHYIRGTYDFIGVSYRRAFSFVDYVNGANVEIPSFDDDLGYIFKQYTPVERYLHGLPMIHPSGLRDALNWVREQYGDQEIYILENGYSGAETLHDYERLNYLHRHLRVVLDAINDGCRVTAYTAWSLMDGFEWNQGYKERSGFYEVDFNSRLKTRTPKLSALAYRDVIRNMKPNATDVDYFDLEENFDQTNMVLSFGACAVIIVGISWYIFWLERKRIINFLCCRAC